MHIPIIGNGDITSAGTAQQRFEDYGVDGIMVGRATFGRPWLFAEIKHLLCTGEPLPPQSFEWYLNVLRRQVRDSVAQAFAHTDGKSTPQQTERRGIIHVRRHLANSILFKGIPDFKQTRIALLRADTAEELFHLMDGITRA
jgi:tRNA-dihydrouridine synthase